MYHTWNQTYVTPELVGLEKTYRKHKKKKKKNSVMNKPATPKQLKTLGSQMGDKFSNLLTLFFRTLLNQRTILKAITVTLLITMILI